MPRTPVGGSPLSERVALALARSDEAQRVIETLPARRRHPALVLAALHDLALAGRAPELAHAYAAADGAAAAAAAVETVLRAPDELTATAVRRRVRTDTAERCPVLYPGIAEAARRTGADAVGLVDVGCVAGLNLLVDRVGIAYDDGPVVGDAASPVQLSASVVGGRPVPTRAVPEVVARVGTDPDPLDVTDAADARWLRACVPPDQHERLTRLETALTHAAAAPPVLVPGEAVDVLDDALALVPPHALPVLLTTWALARLSVEERLLLLGRLEAAARSRPVAWVSAEGVGVAPGVPTLGDRHASGHSIIGLVVLDGSFRHAVALGRCWSRGRQLAWLSGPGHG